MEAISNRSLPTMRLDRVGTANAPMPGLEAGRADEPSPAVAPPGEPTHREGSDVAGTPRAPAGSVIAPPIANYVGGRLVRRKGEMSKLQDSFEAQIRKEDGFIKRLNRNLDKAGRKKNFKLFPRKPEKIAKEVDGAKASHESAVKKEAKLRAERQVLKNAGWKTVARDYAAAGAGFGAAVTALTSGYRNLKAVKKGEKTTGAAATDIAQDVGVSAVAGCVAGVAAGLLASRLPVTKIGRVGAGLVGYFGSAAASVLVAESLDRGVQKLRGQT